MSRRCASTSPQHLNSKTGYVLGGGESIHRMQHVANQSQDELGKLGPKQRKGFLLDSSTCRKVVGTCI